jgi:hypothetical protein
LRFVLNLRPNLFSAILVGAQFGNKPPLPADCLRRPAPRPYLYILISPFYTHDYLHADGLDSRRDSSPPACFGKYFCDSASFFYAVRRHGETLLPYLSEISRCARAVGVAHGKIRKYFRFQKKRCLFFTGNFGRENSRHSRRITVITVLPPKNIPPTEKAYLYEN